jgi:hypothetical protein
LYPLNFYKLNEENAFLRLIRKFQTLKKLLSKTYFSTFVCPLQNPGK